MKKTESIGASNTPQSPIRVLFVCAGNICRSPLAEGIFRNDVESRGLSDRFIIDSAGTGGWHVGSPPDSRMRETSNKHGISLDQLKARQFVRQDLDRFDLIFVMDRDNLNDVLSHDSDNELGYKVRLFRELDPEPDDYQVPDPYYGGLDGYERVFQVINRTSSELVTRLIEEYSLV